MNHCMVERGTMSNTDAAMTMKEVSHEPTEGDSVTNVWNRGEE